ncbi:MAG: hypothetical protein M0R80_12205 [Proteobacteria bacterium]|jgi:hypothetical protein|nr:hypothetical protein [Pseudomonadota bacterium]
MTDTDAMRLVASATMLGVFGAWLLGVWSYVRLGRRARTAAARRIIRCVVSAPARLVANRLVQDLATNPHFVASITGQLESVLTAIVTLPAEAARGGRPAARVACRLDDLGDESRLRLRIDFSPILERFRAASQLWMFLCWPIWMFLTVGFAVPWLVLYEPTSPWYGLVFGFGALPAIGQIAIVARCNGVRRYLGDAVVGVAEDIRSSLLV